MSTKKIVFAGLFLGCGWPVLWGVEEPKVEVAKPLTYLFLGDSITRAGGYVRAIATELGKQNPTNPPRVINHGRNSETISNLSEPYHPGRRPCVLSRLDQELAAAKPDWLVACYGINCGIYHPFNEKRLAAYQAGIEILIKKAQASGSQLILLTPPPYAKDGPPLPDGISETVGEKLLSKANAEAELEAEKNPNKFGYRTPYVYYDRVMARYADWLLTLDGRKNLWVIDIRGPMLARSAETHGRDPIHPNGRGHLIMAEAFLKKWPLVKASAEKASKE
jgi:lysophospholipase L1-like esterase